MFQTRMQSLAPQIPYRGVVQAISVMGKQEGVGALYRGKFTFCGSYFLKIYMKY